MFRQGIIAVMVLGLGFTVLATALPDIVSRSETVRTNAAQQTGLACNSGSGTSCSVTLTSEHAHRDTTGVVITETSPGSVDRSSGGSLGTDRKTLTVSGLTTSTAYVFTVDYLTVDANVSGTLNQFLVSLPLLLVVGLLALILFTASKTFLSYK